jgi:superfamily II DNA or RNA helicase
VDGLKSLEEGLRDWQRVALEEWRKYDFRGIIEVVTGGGKTRFALAAASAWLAGQGSDAAVLIIVPTTALQDQWYVNLTSDLGIEPEKISLWPEKRDVTAKFHVMVVNTARNRAQELARVRPNLLLIADECH